MSEIKLNLVDNTSIYSGVTSSTLAITCVASLAADPKTISELLAALERYEKEAKSSFSSVHSSSSLDLEAYDAGVLIIDLGARVVVCNSTCLKVGPEGQVTCYDQLHLSSIDVDYCLADDWLFTNSFEEYLETRDQRRNEHSTSQLVDGRPILYGRQLSQFLAIKACTCVIFNSASRSPEVTHTGNEYIADCITEIHREWLMTPRDDLRGNSPRQIMLARRELIDFDMESRMLQWSFQLEGPPPLSRDSAAYRYGGSGTHEWVMYYELIRSLLSGAFGRLIGPRKNLKRTHHCSTANYELALSNLSDLTGNVDQALLSAGPDSTDCEVVSDLESLVSHLETLKLSWLTEPNLNLDGSIPFLIIENERRRLPEAVSSSEFIVDEDCPTCRMMACEIDQGLGVSFRRFDTCNMDEEFAFSTCLTEQEWQKEHAEFLRLERDFQRRWQERERKLNEERNSSFLEQFGIDDYQLNYLDPELPES
jgi:hypothetical protein